MHDGMQYDPIQGKGQGHEPFKFGNPAIFKSNLFHHLHWQLATDNGFLNYSTMYRPKFDRAGFLIFVLVLCHVTLNLAETSVAKSRPSVPYGVNLNFVRKQRTDRQTDRRRYKLIKNDTGVVCVDGRLMVASCLPLRWRSRRLATQRCPDNNNNTHTHIQT